MAGGDDMLRRSEAVPRVLALREAALADRPTETVELGAISGRVLADPIVAAADRPAYDRATMDGFAFDATDTYPLAIANEVFPEDDPPAIEAGEAVRIATGAPLPERANAVLKREEATVEDGQLRGPAIEPGTYVYRRASNVAAGETLFEAGERLAAKDAIFLRDLGVERPSVYERFGVGVLATGTEIHEGRSTDLDSPMLCGLVRSWGGEATYEGTVPDEFELVRDRIAALADRYDVVCTTGGTSVGTKDYAVRALAALGEVAFHRVRVRPGKPIAAARLPERDAVAFAIPGKPIGAYTVSTLVMRPFFVGNAVLPTLDARFARDLALGPEGFEYVVPVTLDPGGTDDREAADDRDERARRRPTSDRPDGDVGMLRAVPLGHVDSPLQVYEGTFDPSVLSQSTRATRADGVVVTDAAIAAGETVSVLPYAVLE